MSLPSAGNQKLVFLDLEPVDFRNALIDIIREAGSSSYPAPGGILVTETVAAGPLKEYIENARKVHDLRKDVPRKAGS